MKFFILNINFNKEITNEQEKNELMEIAIKKAIKHYKKTGEIEMAASKYDWLDSKGMLQGDQTNEEWNNIKKEK